MLCSILDFDIYFLCNVLVYEREFFWQLPFKFFIVFFLQRNNVNTEIFLKSQTITYIQSENIESRFLCIIVEVVL